MPFTYAQNGGVVGLTRKESPSGKEKRPREREGPSSKGGKVGQRGRKEDEKSAV